MKQPDPNNRRKEVFKNSGSLVMQTESNYLMFALMESTSHLKDIQQIDTYCSIDSSNTKLDAVAFQQMLPFIMLSSWVS